MSHPRRRCPGPMSQHLSSIGCEKNHPAACTTMLVSTRNCPHLLPWPCPSRYGVSPDHATIAPATRDSARPCASPLATTGLPHPSDLSERVHDTIRHESLKCIRFKARGRERRAQTYNRVNGNLRHLHLRKRLQLSISTTSSAVRSQAYCVVLGPPAPTPH